MAAVIIVSIHPDGRWPLVYKCHTYVERKYYVVFTEYANSREWRV